MNVYFVTNSETHLEEIVERLNFEIVLVGRGHFSSKACIWMGWQQAGDDKNGKWFKALNECFGLEKLKIEPIKSTLFPEELIWEYRYDDIIVCGASDELQTYIRRFCIFAKNSKANKRFFPQNFIYKLECEVTENNGKRTLNVNDNGFLFEGDE